MRQLALVERGIDRAGTDEGGDAGDSRDPSQRIGHGLGALLHLREGDVLVGLDHGGDQAGVLLGKKPLGMTM